MSQSNPRPRSLDLDAYVASGDTAHVPESVKKSDATRSQGNEAFPWMEAGVSPDRKRPCSIRMPETEYHMLRWLGETTYGEGFQSLMLAGARDVIKRMMLERGFRVQEDEKTGQLIVLEAKKSG